MADHEGTPTGVSLVSEKQAVTIPDTIKLTANADRDLYGTGYSVVVVDDDSGALIGSACWQTPCVKYGTTSWANNANPQPRHFHAELRGPGGGTVASSAAVTVEVRKHTWEIVSVVATPQSRIVPGDIQFRATLDHSVYGNGGGYQIHIYDEDSPTWPATCGYSDYCVKHITRNWADNLSPKPGRVRVEVRNSSGDIASNVVYEEAQFRRFVFKPTLSFSTKTWPDGHVDQVASARMASTDPSLYGTGYQIKIKKADGTQLCSAPQVGCDATVTVGGTYRTVIENTAGHVAGASGTWLLTESGPESTMLGAVDLAYVASGFATVNGLCEELLLRGGFSGGDTLPDWYQACETALAAGKTVVQALVAVAAVQGGAAIIHMVASDQIAPLIPEPEEATPDDSVVYRPLPLPIWIEIQDLADRLQHLNPKLEAPGADEVATQCKLFMGRLGRPADDCLLHPILAPGSDMPEITKNTLVGLGRNSKWAMLHYEDPVPKALTVRRDWYSGVPPCVDYSGTGQQCDEFPYFSSLEGGPPPPGGTPPTLRLVPAVEQSRQAGHLTSFYTSCGLRTRPNNPPFWVIPMYWNGPKTVKLCNGWGPPVAP